MGDKYSKEEKKDIEYLKKIIDKALHDDNKYEIYQKTLKIIINLFDTKKKNIEKYTIDYIKYLIKNPVIKNKTKFRSLIFLKDLMKKKNEILIKYTSVKILDRLFLIINSKLKEKCLLEFNRESNLEYSTRFYFLLLECFENWGKIFGYKEKKFKKYYEILLNRHVLPTAEVYYNFPHNQIAYENEKMKNLNFLKKKIYNFIRMRESIGKFIFKEYEKESFFFDLKKSYNSYRDFFISMKSKKINNIIKQNKANKKNNNFLSQLKLEKQFFVEFEKIFFNFEKEKKLNLFFKDLKKINKNILKKDTDIKKILEKIEKEQVIKEEKDNVKEEEIKEKKIKEEKTDNFSYKKEEKKNLKNKNMEENDYFYEMKEKEKNKNDEEKENDFFFKMTEKNENENYQIEAVEKKIDFEFTLKKKDLEILKKNDEKDNYDFQINEKKKKKNNTNNKNSSVKKKSKFFFKESKKIITSNEFEIEKKKKL